MKRREFLTTAAVMATAATLLTNNSRAQESSSTEQWKTSYSGGPVDVIPLPPGLPHKDYRPVIIPNGKALPFKIIGGVKVFHLIAEEVIHEFTPGLQATCWGYNGRVNSTVIEAVEGERIRIYVSNKLKVPTSVHWHGIYLPNGMDSKYTLHKCPVLRQVQKVLIKI